MLWRKETSRDDVGVTLLSDWGRCPREGGLSAETERREVRGKLEAIRERATGTVTSEQRCEGSKEVSQMEYPGGEQSRQKGQLVKRPGGECSCCA